MPLYIEMPKLADTMTEGTLVKWRKNVGDKVSTGDVVAEVETDKATMEMESFEDGVLHEHLVQVGQKVPIGARIAVLLGKGEAAPAPGTVHTAAAKPAAAPAAQTASSATPASPGQAAPAANRNQAGPSVPGGRLKSSPLARKLAASKGVDLASLTGTGPGGRIVAKDVQQASPGAAAPKGAPAVSVGVAAVPVPPPGPGDQLLPLSGMRRVIAERLLASKTQIPHFYLHLEVDAAPLMKMRADLNAGADPATGTKLTVNDFILKAVVNAAVKVPAVNAAFAGDAILQFGSVNLSVAVAVDDGLVTPVVRDAQKKSLREVSEAVKDLATRARAKKLKPDEYQGGTITVSNLGAYGVEFFDAIINPPQSVIVSVGAVVKKPVVGPGDTIVAGQRMALGVSADHRVVDGAVAAQYLAELKRLLESPALLLV
jgi:pyruvate dehydrogenase E2 component (dihydrolipoamide acetyltransferase)